MTRPATRGTCSACGCTNDRACAGGCSWADASETLCTRCVPAIPGQRPLFRVPATVVLLIPPAVLLLTAVLARNGGARQERMAMLQLCLDRCRSYADSMQCKTDPIQRLEFAAKGEGIGLIGLEIAHRRGGQ